METKKLKEYLTIVLDMEKNLYIQKKTILKMQQQCEKLGYKKEIKPPKNYTVSESSKQSTYRLTFIIVFVIYCSLIFNIFYLTTPEFIDTSTTWLLIIGAMIIPPLLTILIGYLINKNKERNNPYKTLNESNLRIYDDLCKQDELRVLRELKQKQFLLSKIETLKQQYNNTNNNLNKIYEYNIINNKYKHNIVAISSFLEYLNLERTYGLGYDRSSGDKGAYNIFEEELRMGLIIDKLDIVINKLTSIENSQSVLYESMKQANNKIAILNSSVNSRLKNLENSINYNTEVEKYNAERTATELRYLNDMNNLFLWH